MSRSAQAFETAAKSVEVDLSDLFMNVDVQTVQVHAPTLIRDVVLAEAWFKDDEDGRHPVAIDKNHRTVALKAPTMLRPVDEPGPHALTAKSVLSGPVVSPVANGGEEPTVIDRPSVARDMPVLVVETEDRTVELRVDKSPFVLGRSRDCDAVVDDTRVSRRHAVLEQRPTGWFLVDQESGNGTSVEEIKVLESRLCHGDVIRMGNAVVEFRMPSACRTNVVPIDQRTVLFKLDTADAPVAARPAAPENKPRNSIGTKLFLLVFFLFLLAGGLFILELAKDPPASGNSQGEKIASSGEQDVAEPVTQPSKIPASEPATHPSPASEPAKAPATEPASEPAAELAAGSEAPASEPAGTSGVIAAAPSKSEKTPPAAMDKKARVASVTPEPVSETVPMPVEEAVAGDELASELEMMEESGAEQEVAMVEEIHEDEPAALLRRASLAAYLRGDLDDALAEAEASGVSADGAAALGRLQEMMGRCKQLYNASEMVEPVEACLWDAYMLDAMLGGGKGRIHAELRAWLGQMYYLLAQKEHNRGDDRAALQELKEALYHAPNLRPALELKEELGKQAS